MNGTAIHTHNPQPPEVLPSMLYIIKKKVRSEPHIGKLLMKYDLQLLCLKNLHILIHMGFSLDNNFLMIVSCSVYA